MVLQPNLAWGRSVSMPTTTTTSSRGAFSFHAGGGIANTRLLNPDGTYSTFAGSTYAGGIDLRIGGGGPGEFRLFGLASFRELKSSVDSNVTISGNTVAGGIKIFTNDYLYLSAGLGANSQSIKSEGITLSLTNQTYMAQIGLELPVYNSFLIELAGNWQVNSIRKTEEMNSHGFTDGISGYLMLVYSPPDTMVTNVFGKWVQLRLIL